MSRATCSAGFVTAALCRSTVTVGRPPSPLSHTHTHPSPPSPRCVASSSPPSSSSPCCLLQWRLRLLLLPPPLPPPALLLLLLRRALRTSQMPQPTSHTTQTDAGRKSNGTQTDRRSERGAAVRGDDHCRLPLSLSHSRRMLPPYHVCRQSTADETITAQCSALLNTPADPYWADQYSLMGPSTDRGGKRWPLVNVGSGPGSLFSLLSLSLHLSLSFCAQTSNKGRTPITAASRRKESSCVSRHRSKLQTAARFAGWSHSHNSSVAVLTRFYLSLSSSLSLSLFAPLLCALFFLSLCLFSSLCRLCFSLSLLLVSALCSVRRSRGGQYKSQLRVEHA